jgi:hypothetical protein
MSRWKRDYIHATPEDMTAVTVPISLSASATRTAGISLQLTGSRAARSPVCSRGRLPGRSCDGT